MQVFKFVFLESEIAVVSDLSSDLIQHLRSELHTLVAASESPRRLVVRKLMIDSLTHRKLIQVVFQGTLDYLFHKKASK